MAGRGTDIILGGNSEYSARADLRKLNLSEEHFNEAVGHGETDNADILKSRSYYRERLDFHKKALADEAEQVRNAGGLFIIGTERHESRRIDNQLRGRAGRQGDSGASRFFLALDDDLMRLFGAGRVVGMMERLGFDEDTPIEQKMLTKGIETAQKRVESRNFQIRKTVLQYDDVMNRQREIIYGQRKKVLNGEDVRDNIRSMLRGVVEQTVNGELGAGHCPDSQEQFLRTVKPFYGLFLKPGDLKYDTSELNNLYTEDLIEVLMERADEAYGEKEKSITPQLMREMERVILLRTVDSLWMDHIDAMHELRQGIGLRAYAQTDPVVAYKHEGFEMFDAMINSIRETTVRTVFTARLNTPDAPKREQVAKVTGESLGGERVKNPTVRKTPKIGRNDPCPCGSGKKYKKCCGFDAGSGGEAE
jgi:preprotein translocase subunit SecA